MSFAYSDNGRAFRAVDDGYAAQAGEALFADYATLDQIVAAFPGYAPTVERQKVPKSIVQQRLIDAGKIAAAFTALNSNPVYFARWFAPDHPSVFADDPDALALLAAIGADPAVIMAAEDGQ